MSTSRCLVLAPFLTHIEPACERGLRELERRGLAVRRYAATAAVDRTRCEAASSALADGYDEIVWIDSDISFDPDDVEKLRTSPHPIIAGAYAKKGARALALQPEPGTRELRLGEGGGTIAVRYVGAGFLLTRRPVFDDIQRTFSLPVCNTRFGAPMIPYFLPMVIADPARAGAYWYLGEDYAFCERARQAGHQTFVDTTIRLGHVGSYTYGWEDAGQAVTRVTGVAIGFPPDE
ncbi:MAG: hypothetical protein IPQ07_23295 [Myxococcales bacterium]|nr:hypothetical protein [Myxococcales bacterium]